MRIFSETKYVNRLSRLKRIEWINNLKLLFINESGNADFSSLGLYRLRDFFILNLILGGFIYGKKHIINQ